MEVYVAGINGGDNNVNDLGFVGASGDAANVNPIGILSVFVQVQIHVMNVVVHGGVFSRIERCPAVDVEVVDYRLSH